VKTIQNFVRKFLRISHKHTCNFEMVAPSLTMHSFGKLKHSEVQSCALLYNEAYQTSLIMAYVPQIFQNSGK